MALDRHLNATYEKISTLHLLHIYKNNENYSPNECQICGEDWELNDKAYRHINLDGEYFVNGVCEECVRKRRVAEQL